MPRYRAAGTQSQQDLADETATKASRGQARRGRRGPVHPPITRDQATLSPSELRVLRYLPTNLTRPEIAGELSVSLNTVNNQFRVTSASPC